MLAFALVGTVAWIVTGQLLNIVDQFPSYKANIHDKIQSLGASHGSRLRNATNTVTELSNELSRREASSIQWPQNRSQVLGRARVPFPCASARYKKISRKLAQSRNFGGQGA